MVPYLGEQSTFPSYYGAGSPVACGGVCRGPAFGPAQMSRVVCRNTASPGKWCFRSYGRE